MRGLCAAAVALAPLLALADVSAPTPLPELSAADGVLLEKEQARRCMRPARYFTPAVSDVRNLEKLLPAALKELAAEDSYRGAMAKQVLGHVATDRRYYYGVLSPDDQMPVIHIEGVCMPLARQLKEKCPPMVYDGGPCVWYIDFRPKSGAFSRFVTGGS
jgi:hypothetical protein